MGNALSHGPEIVFKNFPFSKLLKGKISFIPDPKLCGKFSFFPILFQDFHLCAAAFPAVPLTRVKSQCEPGVRNVKELPRLRGYLGAENKTIIINYYY